MQKDCLALSEAPRYWDRSNLLVSTLWISWRYEWVWWMSVSSKLAANMPRETVQRNSTSKTDVHSTLRSSCRSRI